MRDDGFHAIGKKNRDGGAWDRLFSSNRTTLHIEVKLKSGRTFRYYLSEYRFGPNLTPLQVREIAERIAREKYRHCDWDRNHPRVAAETEIADALERLVIEAVEEMRVLDQRDETGSTSES